MIKKKTEKTEKMIETGVNLTPVLMAVSALNEKLNKSITQQNQIIHYILELSKEKDSFNQRQTTEDFYVVMQNIQNDYKKLMLEIQKIDTINEKVELIETALFGKEID
jgi:hypothetical protein